MANEVAVTQRAVASVEMGNRGLRFTSLEEMYRFARYVVSAGLGGREATAEEVLVRVQVGMELGFSPMRALSAVHVVEGRATLDYKAVLAKIREVGICDQGPLVGNDGTDDDRVGYIEFKRRDLAEPIRVQFSVAQAKVAKLWGKMTQSGKPTPWVLYPDDMLIARAVGRANNRYFSDVTMGLRVTEEARDIEPAEPRDVTPGTPPPEPDPLLLGAGGSQQEVGHAAEQQTQQVQEAALPHEPDDIDSKWFGREEQ